MKTHGVVLLALALGGFHASARPINLGCNARGALAALEDSSALREAIGDVNPANYLGSVYDANGEVISPASLKSLQCPLFIDSGAKPSASLANAILKAEAAMAPKEEEPAALAGEAHAEAVVVLDSENIVAEIPQAALQKARPGEGNTVNPAPEAQSTRTRRPIGVSTARSERHAKTVAKPAPVTAAPPVVAEPQPAQAVAAARPSFVEPQPPKSTLLAWAEATGLIRNSGDTRGEAALEINPAVAIIGFVGVFLVVLVICVVILWLAQDASKGRTQGLRYGTFVKEINPDYGRAVSALVYRDRVIHF